MEVNGIETETYRRDVSCGPPLPPFSEKVCRLLKNISEARRAKIGERKRTLFVS
jgi:hypothetical protein